MRIMTVHEQKSSWKKQSTISGMTGDADDGAARTLMRPKLLKLPM